ncbi:hypothetical protein A5666_14405 [Mycolicibacterium fortuitum]|nr:hypothetical protein A5665_18465 [Mycolicibacterium fortuitum]OBI61520.1 hypothetical protein A5666_14405 [Mycolicibacterium fortuitum]
MTGSTKDEVAVSATAALEIPLLTVVAVTGGGARGDTAIAPAPTSAIPAVVNGRNANCIDGSFLEGG